MIRAFAMLALLWALAPTPAKAETTECTQITAVPATISKQGVYCLKADLATNISSGNAITIATNNVTLDCNGFKLGGLGAGLTTRANGVYAEERMNITIRNCAIRGFHRGIVLTGTTLSSGHRVHDNLLDGTTYLGIRINGDSSHIRDNRVVNTGGTDDANGTYSAILMTGSGGLIANNDVNRVTSLASPPRGIVLFGQHHVVEHNRISGLIPPTGATVLGIHWGDGHNIIRDNAILVQPGTIGWPLRNQSGDATTVCSGNAIMGFDHAWLASRSTTALDKCNDGGGNVAN